ncbi:hypothetical protein M514_00292 [Trichuris suis]|uniref:FIT family protein n=1 Tax=Trichuris suis TaxID=68888 RepID=A0A085MN03_9BILA|nr:hypothetical protein M513_00292 [Trichuris suis]KFD68565.1 hypothetical protein M514_00292 [Trichuris suis]KHJ44003.1 hypothetical protein D918_05696 [Trichuris suis]
MHLLKKYVLFPIEKKVLIFSLWVLVASFAADFANLPRHYYFVRKDNIFNVFFVKWGWAWLLVFLGPFVWYSAQVYTINNRSMMNRHCSRLAIATVIWYLCVAAFVRVQRYTGFCTKTSHESLEMCVSNGGRWVSFDISGHCFLLIYSCLLISEELVVFRKWDNLKKLLEQASDASPPPQVTHLSMESVEYCLMLHRELTPRIRALFICNCLLNLLWEFMLVVTTLYYHSFAQKFVGAAIAIGCWFFTYRVWYPLPCSPGQPGFGALNYQ